jgi:hypothetical protein
LTHASQLSAEVVAGKRVWQKYNCNDCHTILGFWLLLRARHDQSLLAARS